MASVSLQGISKVYPGEVHAVRDLDLEIRDGEFLVLVGPSGCGKSTTLRMIAGLENISSGTLKIGDRVVNEVHPRDRDIAMVFQNYALYPHMTVYDNMAFALKMRKVPKDQIKKQVNWAAQMLGLEPLLGRKPKALSGGQRQRVALGRAIVRKPAVFLFDEPLSNLDAKLRVETRAEIKRLHRELNTTTIYVTHDQEEAMTLGDRVVVMCDGWIRQADSPLTTYQTPADRFVAGFLGMPPMNFFEGYLEPSDGKIWFVGVDSRLQILDSSKHWLQGNARRQVVAGIRPECLELLDPAEANYDHCIEATVQVSELLGSTMDVYLQTGSGNRLVCRAPAAPILENTKIAVRALPEDIHIFEPNEAGDTKSSTYYGRNLNTLVSQPV